jgi:uncharacterized spore protein YtfJ
MGESMNLFSVVKTQAEASELIGKLFETAKPSGVFSEPITTEGYTVITASEVAIGMGMGYGLGGNIDYQADAEAESPSKSEGKTPTAHKDEVGCGGGGGGGANARPVAVIKITSDGVTVEPIVDVTKIALAMFTTVASMFVMMSKIWGKK